MEFLPIGAGLAGFGVSSNQPERVSQPGGVLAERPDQEKDPNRYPKSENESACSRQRAHVFSAKTFRAFVPAKRLPAWEVEVYIAVLKCQVHFASVALPQPVIRGG